jgi:hypothetical protein
MNKINHQDKSLKIIKFNNFLYRADPYKITNYKGANIKYFTQNKKETNTYANYYARQGSLAYITTWKPIEDLILIDILHKPTRIALSELIGKKSLDISFPIIGNIVSRISEEDTKNEDYKVLKDICSLNIADGYIMNKLENNNGKYVFHSEIGLCSNAFSKLELISSVKNLKNPPAPKTRKNKHKRINYTINKNNKNNKNNNMNNAIPKVKRSSPTIGALKFNF